MVIRYANFVALVPIVKKHVIYAIMAVVTRNQIVHIQL